MISTKLIDQPRVNGVPLGEITSAGRTVQGVRDQTGVATGIIFNGTATPDYKFEVQGSADDGATWHPLAGSELGGTAWTEQRVGGISFTIEFPLMPMIRFIFSQNAGGSGATGDWERCEAWLVE